MKLRTRSYGMPLTVKRMARSGAQVPQEWVPWSVGYTAIGSFANYILMTEATR